MVDVHFSYILSGIPSRVKMEDKEYDLFYFILSWRFRSDQYRQQILVLASAFDDGTSISVRDVYSMDRKGGSWKEMRDHKFL